MIISVILNGSFPQLVNKTMFLGVGAQKSGTTWLSNYLAGHPEVYMSALKEMHFWGNRTSTANWPNSAFRKRLKRMQEQTHPDIRVVQLKSALRERLKMDGDIEKYVQYFDTRVQKQHAFGEISPAYCKLPLDEFELIKSHFPDIKVIFLMRNPTDRLWSQIRFSEDAETLEAMEQKIDTAFEKPVYLDRMDYVSTIRTIQSCFAPENIHFEFFERLFTPEAVDRVCNFLGVGSHPGEFSKKRNVSVKMPLQLSLRVEIVRKLEPQYAYVRDLFDGDIPLKWQNDLTALQNTL
ncbi:MAG: sulfotransferase [Amylibacter sp.]|nr:sulfotransferase [Amylibacter sp.]